jgi:hypothetical protein
LAVRWVITDQIATRIDRESRADRYARRQRIARYSRWTAPQLVEVIAVQGMSRETSIQIADMEPVGVALVVVE